MAMKNITHSGVRTPVSRPDAYTRPSELWYQTDFDADLWEATSGVIVNTDALNEREAFYQVVRVPANAVNTQPVMGDLAA